MNSFSAVLQSLAETGRLRELHPISDRQGSCIDRDGRSMLNLSSNDYLGIAGNRQLHHEFFKGLESGNILNRYGLGAASSRLLSGDHLVMHQLEHALKEAYRKPAALLYNSGYHANIGILPALFGKRDLILSDKLNHASIHDGLRLSTAAHKRYRHLDYQHLEQLLDGCRHEFDRVAIVSESVFSMDGDVADLRELVRIKNQYNCLLYVDEAHAIGLYGALGLGTAEAQGVLAEIDLLVGPLGKAFASAGAFVLCSEDIRQYLVNHSRSLIFTTALPPIVVHWSLFVLSLIAGMQVERQHLLEISGKLRRSLVDHGLNTRGETNIVPVLVGDNQKTVAAASRLQELGYLVLPVRPPTVPEGTARFRLSLTADMQWSDLQHLAATLAECLQPLSPEVA